MRYRGVGAAWFALMASSCVLLNPLSGLSDGTDATDAGADSSDLPDTSVATDGPAVDAQVVPDATLDTTPIIDAGPPAFVQLQATSSKNAATAAVTFEAGVGEGDTIIVALGYPVGDASAASLVSVNDTQNDTFTAVYDNISPSGRRYYLATAVGVKAGPDNVSVQLDAPVGELELYVHEYANISAFGVAAGASGASGTAVDGMQSPLVTTTVPNELIFGYGTTGHATVGTGLTVRSIFHDNVTEDRLLPTPGSYRTTATSVYTATWTMIAATFKPR